MGRAVTRLALGRIVISDIASRTKRKVKFLTTELSLLAMEQAR